MTNNKDGAQKGVATQIEKYGSVEAYRAEMSRRAKQRKTIGKGGFYDKSVARRANARSIEVRRNNAKNKAKIQEKSQPEETATEN